MSKIFRTAGAAIVMMMFCLSFSVSAKAADCSESMDALVKAYGEMAKAIDAIEEVEELDFINFDDIVERAGLMDVPEEAIGCTLTASDRKKLKDGFNVFYNAIVNKIYDLSGRVISRETIDEQMKEMREQHDTFVDNSETLGDYLVALTYFGA